MYAGQPSPDESGSTAWKADLLNNHFYFSKTIRFTAVNSPVVNM